MPLAISFDELIADKPAGLQTLGKRLRSSMLTDGVSEAFYGGDKVRLAYYSIGDINNTIGVISFTHQHCKLFLHHVDKIDSGDIPFEGQGKHSRHVKLVPDSDLSGAIRAIEEVKAIVSELAP